MIKKILALISLIIGSSLDIRIGWMMLIYYVGYLGVRQLLVAEAKQEAKYQQPQVTPVERVHKDSDYLEIMEMEWGK